ncbi:sigma-70 family RNA polymerase sigma factor [Nocardioides sp. W7]|uniref:sigma-70 family RNA polymerase sigma factor n=1 Tax=Nocardioides sp. W7 TaxID=2931390 RepID=UPI001FD04442|nr:sigma-70 family RNA polymerase sigma factor [Nocardioides sp. W7]
MTSSIERESVSDVDLIGDARTGDEEAIEELYRRHREPALRFARSLTDPVTAEDVVAEAFVKVLESIRSGGGPSVAFRPYLLTAVRNTYVSHVRRDSRHVWVDDHESSLDRPTDADVTDHRHESALLAAAFATLPERWQAVLWHSTVEDEDHVTIGRRLGLKPNAVAALGFRARDGLRRAYLDAHLGAADEHCRPYRELLAPYVRGHLRTRRREEVQRHLGDCPACTAGYLELSAINANLGAVLAPALLGVTAASYAVLTGGTGGAVGLAGGSPLRHWARVHRGATATGVAVAATVVVTTASFALVSALGPSEAGTGAGSTSAGASTVPDEPSGTAGIDSHEDPAPTLDERPRASARPGLTPASPSATPSSAPSGSTAPTPEPSETPTGAAPGGGKDTPTGTPSTAPTAAPTPSTTPTEPSPTVTTSPTPDPVLTHLDLGLTGGSVVWYGPHHHVGMQVAGGADPTILTVVVRGLESYTVHSEAAYVPGTCTTSATDGDLSTLSCLLEPTGGSFAIDLVVTGAQGALDATARVSAADNLDPEPGNDELHFTG